MDLLLIMAIYYSELLGGPLGVFVGRLGCHPIVAPKLSVVHCLMMMMLICDRVVNGARAGLIAGCGLGLGPYHGLEAGLGPRDGPGLGLGLPSGSGVGLNP